MAKCISCGAENPAGEKFCSECGMRLPDESTGGAPMSSAVPSVAGAEQLAAYKSEAMVALKAGPVNLMSRRKLKMLQKRLGLTDAQAQDAEEEILAEIERMKAEEQERAAEEDTGFDSSDSEDAGETDDENEDSYQEVFDRVKRFLERFEYYPKVDEDDGTVSMAMDDEGQDRMLWNSVREFLLAPWDDHHANFNEPGCVSIFKAAFFWEDCGDRVIPKVRSFMEACGLKFSHGVFEDMDDDAPPELIMELLDEAKIGADAVSDGTVSNADNGDDSNALERGDSDDSTALRKVGATVELFDHDVGTRTKGSCSVVLQRVPSGLGRCDKVMIGTEVAKLLGCMPANGFKMIDDLPLTVAENVSREEAIEIAATFKKRKCVVEIVGDDDDDAEEGDDSSEGTNDDVDFDAIRDYIESFKESVGCNDIVLPDASSFDKKWTNLSNVLENSFDDLSLDQDDAIAILDCTVFGSAKNGVLIDRTGIYTNNDDDAFSGWMDWNGFKANGSVEKIGSYDVQVYDEPDFNFGVNVSGCSLSQDNTVRFFNGLLELVRGEGCKTPVPQAKTCPKCGAQLKPEAKFCSECGASV